MIIQSIVRGAKGFAKEFRKELNARYIARGTIALQKRAEALERLDPQGQKEYHDDVADILKRSNELVRARMKKDA